MAVNSTQYFAYQIDFNSVSYTSSSGGPLEVTETENPNVLKDKTGASVLATFVETVGLEPTVFVKLRDTESVPARNAISSLVVYYKEQGGNRKRTYTTMKYIAKDTSYVHAGLGEVVLRFDHQSADGTTEWYSDAAAT